MQGSAFRVDYRCRVQRLQGSAFRVEYRCRVQRMQGSAFRVGVLIFVGAAGALE